jgi:hypothetical protein
MTKCSARAAERYLGRGAAGSSCATGLTKRSAERSAPHSEMTPGVNFIVYGMSH